MKKTITVLSASLLTVALSGAALAAPDLSPVYQSPLHIAPTALAQSADTHPAPASHQRLTVAQASRECQALEHRFDRRAAPEAMKVSTTPQGALRAEGAMLCKSHPYAGDRYLRAAIATLNAQLHMATPAT